MIASAQPDRPFPATKGELSGLIRSFAWSSTPLGPIGKWQQSLRIATELLLLSQIPIVLLWAKDGNIIYNDAYADLLGCRHPDMLGSKVRQGCEAIADYYDHLMLAGAYARTLVCRNQGLILQTQKLPKALYSPVLDENGVAAGAIGFVSEMTDRRPAKLKFREAKAQFRAMFGATFDVFYLTSPDFNEKRELGLGSHQEGIGGPDITFLKDSLPDDEPVARAALKDAITNKKPFNIAYRVKKTDGSVGWTRSRGVPVLNDDGEVSEWFECTTDVTEQYRTNEQLKLVTNELDHRVKNTLAMVQAIALRTFRDDIDISVAQDIFAARLIALAQANDLLNGERQPGASLRRVIGQAVHPHQRDANRFSLNGPDLKLPRKFALALALIVHELSSNALRHGAWSNDSGVVDISCSISGDVEAECQMEIIWQENGGPLVTAPPQLGFGARLIERGFAGETNGQVQLRFAPNGVRCVISAEYSVENEG